MKKKIILIALIITVVLLLLGLLITNNHNKKNDNYEIKLNEEEIIKTKYYDFDDGKFSLKIPESFDLMEKEIIEIKYPNDRRPNIVYTNEDTSINIAISLTNTEITDVEEYTRLVKEVFSELYGEVEIKIYEKNNHKIGEIKLISPALDTTIYNNMMFFELDGKLRIVTFNCISKLQEEWEKVGDFIIDSLIIND